MDRRKFVSALGLGLGGLALAGCEVEEVDSGCCGMAGAFGYEKEHYDISMKVGEERLFKAVRSAGEGVVIAAVGTTFDRQFKALIKDPLVLGNEGESPFYLKRIIGLPGDRIGIRRGQMTVNGNVYEDYGHGRIDARLRPLVLAEGEFFVMGDNRPISMGGVVEAGNVLGKIL